MLHHYRSSSPQGQSVCYPLDGKCDILHLASRPMFRLEAFECCRKEHLVKFWSFLVVEIQYDEVFAFSSFECSVWLKFKTYCLVRLRHRSEAGADERQSEKQSLHTLLYILLRHPVLPVADAHLRAPLGGPVALMAATLAPSGCADEEEQDAAKDEEFCHEWMGFLVVFGAKVGIIRGKTKKNAKRYKKFHQKLAGVKYYTYLCTVQAKGHAFIHLMFNPKNESL